MNRNPVTTGLIAAVFFSAVFGIWHLSRLSQQLVRSSALDSAAQQAEILEEVQDFYSDTIVPRAKNANVSISHRYLQFDNRLPVPATFTIDLGQHIARENRSGSFARLYSDQPFKTRTDGGPRTQFERDALKALRKNPKEPFYRFEKYNGRESLLFAKARVMTKSCIDCHNTHEDSPRDDWEKGDVRGVLEIIRPLNDDIARTRDGLRGTFVTMGVLSVTLIAAALLAAVVQRKRES